MHGYMENKGMTFSLFIISSPLCLISFFLFFPVAALFLFLLSPSMVGVVWLNQQCTKSTVHPSPYISQSLNKKSGQNILALVTLLSLLLTHIATTLHLHTDKLTHPILSV